MLVVANDADDQDEKILIYASKQASKQAYVVNGHTLLHLPCTFILYTRVVTVVGHTVSLLNSKFRLN